MLLQKSTSALVAPAFETARGQMPPLSGVTEHGQRRHPRSSDLTKWSNIDDERRQGNTPGSVVGNANVLQSWKRCIRRLGDVISGPFVSCSRPGLTIGAGRHLPERTNWLSAPRGSALQSRKRSDIYSARFSRHVFRAHSTLGIPTLVSEPALRRQLLSAASYILVFDPIGAIFQNERFHHLHSCCTSRETEVALTRAPSAQ